MRHLLILIVLIAHAIVASSQKKGLNQRLVEKFAKNLSTKSRKLQEKTLKQYTVALKEMKSLEGSLKKKMAKKDLPNGGQLFGNIDSVYAKWDNPAAKNVDLSVGSSVEAAYIDSITSAIEFLEKGIDSKISERQKKELLQQAEKLNELKGLMEHTSRFQQFAKERRQYLKQQLEKVGMLKELKQLNKTVFYFGQTLEGYKKEIVDRSAIEKRMLSIVREEGDFKSLVDKKLFGSPLSRINISDNKRKMEAFSGLQTRESVHAIISKMPVDSVNPTSFIKGKTAKVAQQNNKDNGMNVPLGALKFLGDKPDFKINTEKGKGFKKRLEAGINFQFGNVVKVLPNNGELAATLGYKLNDRSVIGVGLSYKIAVSGSFKKININSQGLGLRSFLDWKLKGNYFITGGYEKNFLPALRDVQLPRDGEVSPWQNSALIGAMKKYAIGKRKGAIQLFVDVLSLNKTGYRSPIVFRNAFYF